MKFNFVWTQGVGIVYLSCRCFELSHLSHSCRFVLISDRPFSCQCQTSLNTDLHSMQITAEKLTRCEEPRGGVRILFRPGTIEFSTKDFVVIPAFRTHSPIPRHRWLPKSKPFSSLFGKC